MAPMNRLSLENSSVYKLLKQPGMHLHSAEIPFERALFAKFTNKNAYLGKQESI